MPTCICDLLRGKDRKVLVEIIVVIVVIVANSDQ